MGPPYERMNVRVIKNILLQGPLRMRPLNASLDQFVEEKNSLDRFFCGYFPLAHVSSVGVAWYLAGILSWVSSCLWPLNGGS